LPTGNVKQVVPPVRQPTGEYQGGVMTQRGCGVFAANMKIFAMLLILAKAYPIRGLYFKLL
jgi:hypothetical protein